MDWEKRSMMFKRKSKILVQHPLDMELSIQFSWAHHHKLRKSLRQKNQVYWHPMITLFRNAAKALWEKLRAVGLQGAETRNLNKTCRISTPRYKLMHGTVICCSMFRRLRRAKIFTYLFHHHLKLATNLTRQLPRQFNHARRGLRDRAPRLKRWHRPRWICNVAKSRKIKIITPS